MLSQEQVEKIQKEKLMSRAEIRKFDREWTEVCDRLRKSRADLTKDCVSSEEEVRE